MQQFRMLGTGFQRLLTAKLSVEMPPGPHVLEDGLARNWLRGQPGTFQIGSSSLASGPTFATIHLRNSDSNYGHHL